MKKLYVLEKHGEGWSFSTSWSTTFKDLDEVLAYMKKTYKDFKVIAATDNYIIFETKESQ